MGNIHSIACHAFVVATGAALLGCSSGEYQPSAEDRVSEAISHLADASATPASFQAAFVEAATPADETRLVYGHYTYDATDVTIDGETATAQVSIISPFTDESVGSAEWTCRRVGGTWRMQSAPLPDDLPK